MDASKWSESSSGIALPLALSQGYWPFWSVLKRSRTKHHWTYDALAAVWGSPLVADGKIYLGDEDGDIAVLRAGKKKELIHEVNMGASVYTTPVAKKGVCSASIIFSLRIDS